MVATMALAMIEQMPDRHQPLANLIIASQGLTVTLVWSLVIAHETPRSCSPFSGCAGIGAVGEDVRARGRKRIAPPYGDAALEQKRSYLVGNGSALAD